jgi:hypothetical protein
MGIAGQGDAGRADGFFSSSSYFSRGLYQGGGELRRPV